MGTASRALIFCDDDYENVDGLLENLLMADSNPASAFIRLLKKYILPLFYLRLHPFKWIFLNKLRRQPTGEISRFGPIDWYVPIHFVIRRRFNNLV